ncbi:MAG: hypothetical protein IJS88_00815 [Alphaproteobacteria bacterium]|nr:hypothetical protein [Alphaproteobacteria bacterium]
MKIFLIIILTITYISFAMAQSTGIFIPQKTLDKMNRPEKLPNVYIQKTTVLKSRTTEPAIPENKQAAVPAKSDKSESVQLRTTVDDNTPTIQAQPQPRPAQEPMIPQTGTPAEPIIETEEAKPVKNTEILPSETTSYQPLYKTKEELSYDNIIEEYRNDIQKIGNNIPVNNLRLNQILNKYKDETLTLD